VDISLLVKDQGVGLGAAENPPAGTHGPFPPIKAFRPVPAKPGAARLRRYHGGIREAAHLRQQADGESP
jgi:hypothetical protein